MALQFVFGPSGSGKSYYVDSFLIKESMEHPEINYILLVPEQYSMALQRKMVQMHPNGGTMNIDVIGFNRLAYRVFDELSVKVDNVLEDFGKTMLIRQVAGSIKDDLQVYSGCLDKAGFIDEVKSLMSEMYQYDISREHMNKAIEELESNKSHNSLLVKKLQDMQKIFQGFDEKVGDDFIVAEQIMDILGDYVAKSSFVKNSVIVMDGFTGFTPIQLSLLEKLMIFSMDMKIVLTIDKTNYEKKMLAEHDLFYLTKQTKDMLLDIAEKNHIDVVKDVFLDGKSISRWSDIEDSEIQFLEQNLFRFPNQKYPKAPKNLCITNYESPRKETIGIAETIFKLVKEQKYRYKDIAVISGSLEDTVSYVEQIFPLYGIEYFLDYNRPVKNNPLVDAISQLLRLLCDDFSYDNTFAFLKSGVFQELGDDEIEILENYVLERGIRGHKWWSRDWSERNEEVDEIRAYIMEVLEPVYKSIHGKNKAYKVETIVKSLYQFLDKMDYENRMKDFPGLFDKLCALLDKMTSIMPKDKVTLDEFYELLEVGLRDLTLGMIPNTLDMVIVGDITRTRLDDVKVLFILGVNDGIIPKKAPNAQIISDREKEILAEHSVVLAPTEKMNAYTEQFYLYLNMTKPKEKLYLSYTVMDANNTPLRVSYIIGRVRKLYPLLKVVSERNTGVSDGKTFDITSKKGSMLGLISALNNFNEEVENCNENCNKNCNKEKTGTSDESKNITRANIIKALRLYKESGEEYTVKQIQEAIHYRNIPKQLKGEVTQLLKLRMLSQSVSQIEQYTRCAYSYFLKYTIGLKERKVKSIDNRDIGIILHKTMQNLYEYVKKNNNNDWTTISDELRDELTEKFAAESFEEVYKDQNLEENRYKYLEEMLTRISVRTAEAMTKIAEKDSLKPEYFEHRFEEHMSLKNFIDSFGNVQDVSMSLKGVVDRGDLEWVEEDNTFRLRIIDYKKGKKEFKLNELYEGLQLQLAVYMNVMKNIVEKSHPGTEVEPIGMYYYHMQDPFVEIEKMDDEDEIKAARSKELRLVGLENKNAEEFETILKYAMFKMEDACKSIIQGHIDKKPLTSGNNESACQYCEYADICRFDDKKGGNRYKYMEFATSKNKQPILDKMHLLTDNNTGGEA